jgi:hypothetical protein
MDKRASTRNRVLRPGTIQLDGGVINCMVRNLSSTGAMLDVASPVGIPEHFTAASFITKKRPQPGAG